MVIIVTVTKLRLQVTGVVTQGRADGKEWVTSFMVSYSIIDVNQWQYVTDQYGNRKVSRMHHASFTTLPDVSNVSSQNVV